MTAARDRVLQAVWDVRHLGAHGFLAAFDWWTYLDAGLRVGSGSDWFHVGRKFAEHGCDGLAADCREVGEWLNTIGNKDVDIDRWRHPPLGSVT